MTGQKFSDLVNMAGIYAAGIGTMTDLVPAMVVQYVPDKGTGGTAATAAVTAATDITFTVDSAAPTGLDAIGTSGVVDFATYTTMGTLRDYINGLGPWRCHLLGSLRADASASKLLAAGATSCIGATGLTIFQDSSALGLWRLPISACRFVNNGIGGHITDEDEQALNYLYGLTYHINLATAAGSTLKIYSCSQTADGSAIYSASITAADDVLTNLGYNGLPIHQSVQGERLIIELDDAGTVSTQTSITYAAAKTVCLKSGRLISSKCWPS